MKISVFTRDYVADITYHAKNQKQQKFDVFNKITLAYF